MLEQWMEWERGDETPGRVLANLKTSGLRDLLEQIVAREGEGGEAPLERTPTG
jgi:hypothetical protein